MDDILVPISPGELLDKITILRIKAARIAEPAKLAHVRHELALLEHTWTRAVPAAAKLAAEERALETVTANTRPHGASTRPSSSWRARCTSPMTSARPSRSASMWRSARRSSRRNPIDPTPEGQALLSA
jgi:hypothetical protein